MDVYINSFTNLLKAIIVAGTTLRVIQNLMKCQTDGVSLKDGIHKSKKVLIAGIIAIVLSTLIPLINTYYFKPIDSRYPQMNAVSLISAITNVLIFIEPAVLGYKAIIELVAYKTSDDGMKAEHKSNAIRIAITGVLIMCATAVVGIILNYYK